MKSLVRLPAVAVGLACLLSVTVQALEYPGTCRGPSAVVTSLSGVDSRFVVITAKLSEVDATLFCKGEYSVGRSMGACVSNMTKVAYRAQANCFTGTLTTGAGNLPRPDYPKSSWQISYKFPIGAMCAGDNNQAIAIFKMLCPSYQGKVEE